MSLEQEIKELRGAIAVLTQAMLKMANEGVPTLQADSAQVTQLVPEFLKADGPGLITNETGETGQTADMPEAGPDPRRSAAAKKAAATKKANKEKKALDAAKAKEETEAVAKAEETGFDPFALDDADVPTEFVDEVEEDTGLDFMDAAEAEAEAPGLSVMGEKDPRGALRKHIIAVSKILSETGKAETLAELLNDKEAGFGHSGFKALPENKFDSFLNAAVELLPSDRQKEIG